MVLAVHDLDATSAFYVSLGFTLTPKAEHPFGTSNRLALFGDHFLEIVAVTAPDKVIEHRGAHFSFAAYNREYLRAAQGLSMVALKSSGWERDRRDFSSRGLDLGAPFGFLRQAGQPDGSQNTLEFKLTFIGNSLDEGLKFFTCDHRHPKKDFYKKQFQKHKNSAFQIRDVILAAENPGSHSKFFRQIDQNVNSRTKNREGIVDFGKGRYRIVDPSVLRDRYFFSNPISKTNSISGIGFRIGVKSLKMVKSVLQGNQVPFVERNTLVRINPDIAFGSVIEFCE